VQDRKVQGGFMQSAPMISEPSVPFDFCPLCLSQSHSELRRADCSGHPLYKPVLPKEMRWMECLNCKHVFTDGYFSPEAEAVIFSSTHDYQQPGYQFENFRKLSARMVENVSRYASRGKWLDIGFGNGSLLFTAQEWGFEPVGLDLRPSTVVRMKELGFNAYCEDIVDFDAPDSAAVISMADVLEHMPFPPQGLEAAHRILKQDGILFVSMPHYNCAAWRLLDMSGTNPYWGELEHFHNFSRERLYRLLADSGFEPLSYAISERYRICMEVIARRI
jgi:SAM-dependent methyltransferase